MEFEFNSDVDCRLSLLSSLPDTADLCDLRYSPGTGVTSSQHHLFSKGSEMNFKGRDFPLTPGELREEDLSYDPENGQDTFPFAILMETATGTCGYISVLFSFPYCGISFSILSYSQVPTTRVS